MSIKIGTKLRQCSCDYHGLNSELRPFVYKVVGESSRYWKLEGGGSVSKRTMQLYGDGIFHAFNKGVGIEWKKQN